MRLRHQVLLAVPVFATVLALACTNASEGQPCDQNNGNNDCNNGLICEKPPNPSATNAPAVCCPQDLSQATTSECSQSASLPGGDAAPPPDGAIRADALVDGALDGAIDGPASDAATDALEGSTTDGGDGASDGPTEGSPSEGGTDASGDAPTDGKPPKDSGKKD